MYRCDGCGEECEENELTELEFFQGIPMQNLCSECLAKIFVKKKELDNAADMRMPIKNTIDIAIKKVTE